jgi:flagellar basal-body rod protein FlgB
MTTQSIGLFKALGSKMNYLDQRQRVISQNIANADTPSYIPKDLLPVDFGTVLKKVSSTNDVRPQTTNSMHLPRADAIDDPRSKNQRKVYEEAPVGNAVILEEQLVNSTKTQMDYSLITGLYQKNIAMLRTAIGGQG